MTKLAPELDELMWVIAETQDSAAVEEFGERYPELRGELGKRLAMTRSLRGAVADARPPSVPRFKPTQPPIMWWTRPAFVAAAGVLLVALAFGSYYVARLSVQPEKKPPVVQPDTSTATWEPLNPPVDTRPDPKVGRPAPHSSGPGTSGTTAPPVLPPYMQPRSLSIREGRFMDVITMIGQACGLEIEMPDLPQAMAELQISAEYEDMNGLQMLQDLGAKHGFTAFHQGGNKVLLIPAR